MWRETIQTTSAPAAIGPYVQAVRAGSWIIGSGQLGLDPSTGQLVPGGIEAETRQVLVNIAAILQSAGLSLSAIVKTTVFLADLRDFQAMNAVYAEFFLSNPPARSTVQVAALPKGALIEVEFWALVE